MYITFIQTGGTIDKDYAQTAKTYNFEISEPAVKRVLEKVRPCFDFEIRSVVRKDSLDITESDRGKIYNECVNTKASKIIVTHGTDTMCRTAKVLSQIKNKTIVLVGSSKPEKFYDSDASFNIGVAVGAINRLPNGVYIAMNGRVYNWDKCYKREDDGMFIEGQPSPECDRAK
jgi:L-asparaginase